MLMVLSEEESKGARKAIVASHHRPPRALYQRCALGGSTVELQERSTISRGTGGWPEARNTFAFRARELALRGTDANLPVETVWLSVLCWGAIPVEWDVCVF